MVESNTPAPSERALTEIDRLSHDLPDPASEVTEHVGSDVPGVLFFDPAGRVVSATPNAEGYLRDLGALDIQWREGRGLPLPLQVLLGALEQTCSPADECDCHTVPRLRIQTHSGRWLLLHAARTYETSDRSSERIVVVAPAPEDAAWFVAVAYGLGSWKEELARLLGRGMSTMRIIRLRLAPVHSDRCHFPGTIGKAGTVVAHP